MLQPILVSRRWDNGTERYRFAERDDLASIVRMLADPEVGQWLWFTPAPPETFERYFAPFIDRQTAELARGEIPHRAVFVVEDTRGTFLGEGGAIAVAGSPGGFEIGYQLRRDAWGRGVGMRFARFLCAYAVHRCHAYRIEAACLEGNTGSRRILTKLGLELAGARPGYRLREGVRHTEVLYGAQVRELDQAALRQLARDIGLL